MKEYKFNIILEGKIIKSISYWGHSEEHALQELRENLALAIQDGFELEVSE